MIRNVVCAAFLSSVCAAGLAAQQTTTNPTNPQTRYPQTSSSAMTQNDKGQKVTIAGCLGNAAARAMGATTASAASEQYALNKLDFKSSGSAFDDWARSHGSSASSSSMSSTSGSSVRPTEVTLSAPDSKVDLSKYVGQNIQVTGTISASGGGASSLSSMSASSSTSGAGSSKTGSTTSGTGSTTGAGSTSLQTVNASNGPTVDVTSVKVISKDCNGTY